jgi:hypothetical protein
MRAFLVICLLLSSSCSLRVFQDKVPQPIEKTNKHKEAEKEATYYLANNIQSPLEAKEIAGILSYSLGVPSNTDNTNIQIKNKLTSSISELNRDRLELNYKLKKNAGLEIEGTGFDVMPYMSVTSMVLIIALCVFCPALISVAFFIIKRLRGALKAMVSAIEDYKKYEPEKAQKLKQALATNLDQAHKKIVSKLR